MSAESEPTEPVDPTARNEVWSSIQLALQALFPLVFRYRAQGVERAQGLGGALVLSNHQSFLDPLLIGLPLKRPVSFMARDNLFRVPLVGWVLRKTYVFPVDRTRPTPATIRKAIERLQNGYLVGVFPEGTRHTEGGVGEFKAGFAAILRRAECPVLPVGIAGADRAMPRGVRLPRPRAVRIVFGEPIPYETLQPLLKKGREQELAEFTRAAVVDCQAEAEAWRAR